MSDAEVINLFDRQPLPSQIDGTIVPDEEMPEPHLWVTADAEREALEAEFWNNWYGFLDDYMDACPDALPHNRAFMAYNPDVSVHLEMVRRRYDVMEAAATHEVKAFHAQLVKQEIELIEAGELMVDPVLLLGVLEDDCQLSREDQERLLDSRIRRYIEPTLNVS